MLFVILAILQINAAAQVLLPDTTSSPAIKNAIQFYSTTLHEQLHLYNGTAYHEYVMSFEEGDPYFLQSTWSTGTVNYDGNNYNDVSIMYNLVTDEVIILAYNKVVKIQLLKDRVAGFSLSGHSFIHLTRDSLFSTNMTPGFYDMLANGKITLLSRRTKNIQMYAKQKLEYKVFKKDHFYLKKNNSYFPVRSKKSLLEQLSDKKKEIQQYIKQNKLRFRKDPEGSMVKIAAYYNQLTK